MTDLDPPEKLNSPTRPDGSPGSPIGAGAGARAGGGAGNVPLPLKIAVYAMGVALVVMFVLIGSRFMDRRSESRSSEATQGIPWIIDVEVQASGGVVKSAVLEGRVLTVIIEAASGKDQVILIDTRKGAVIGKVRLEGP